MQATTGTVIDINDTHALVACAGSEQCARCAAGHGCGGALMGKLLGDRLHTIEVRLPDMPLELQRGDAVTLGLSGHDLMRGAATAYLLPLGGLLFGTLLAAMLLPATADAGAIVGAVAGLSGGVVLARRISSGLARRPGLMPVVLARHSRSPGDAHGT